MENDKSGIIDQVKQMHGDGVSIRGIAKRFNRAPSTIGAWLKKPEPSIIRNRAEYTKPNTEEIIALHQRGLSSTQIAEKLNGAKSTVEYRLKQAGITRTNTDGIRLAIADGHMKTPVPKGTRGSHHPCWKGGRFKRGSREYIYIWKPEHPRADKAGYMLEHIWVWEQCHNKPVPKGHDVHHLNGNKGDNRPSNLLALTRKDHHRLWAPYQKRIRELEQENARLRQISFNFDN